MTVEDTATNVLVFAIQHHFQSVTGLMDAILVSINQRNSPTQQGTTKGEGIMGMFDTGIITCPHCKEITSGQTKSFACIMEYYNLDEPIDPYYVAHFSGEWTCEHCEKKFTVKNPLPAMKMKAEVELQRGKE